VLGGAIRVSMSIKMMFQGASDFNGSSRWGWTHDASADTFVIVTTISDMLVLYRWYVATFASTIEVCCRSCSAAG